MLNQSAVRKAGWLFLAVAGLVATWSQMLGDLAMPFLDAQLQFWKDTLLNPASRFITLDLLFLSAGVILWMIIEARRLGIRLVWVYVAFGIVIAISAAFPLFMFVREGRLPPAERDARLNIADQAGIALLVLTALAYAVVALLSQ